MDFNSFLDGLAGKRIAVVGLGVSNRPLAELLAERGEELTVCDRRSAGEIEEYARLSSKGVKFSLGDDYIKDLNYDVVFRTPGLHPMHLGSAREHGAVVTSEMEAFFAVCPCKIIAVTGSDGKTTTTTLIAELLKAQGHTVHLGGNIGRPLLCDVPGMGPGDIAVLELSSFQLHSMKCRPDVAVVTNLSPNHLDVHPDLDDYIEAKRGIFRGQDAGDRLVLNRDNAVTASFAGEARAGVTWFSRRERVDGCWFDGGAIYKGGERLVGAGEVLLPGLHNIENLMAAFCAVDGLVSAENCRRVARGFGGVAHRLELIRRLNGVRYYNDSIASSPTRTIAGLRSFNEKVILIAGGHDKNIPFDSLAREMLRSVKRLYLTGETAGKIFEAVKSADAGQKLPVYVIDDFREAVLAASRSAGEGDIVILSPACSSFDKFRNFEERGNTFRTIVEEL